MSCVCVCYKQYVYYSDVLIKSLGSLLKCRFWFSGSGMELKLCVFEKFKVMSVLLLQRLHFEQQGREHETETCNIFCR